MLQWGQSLEEVTLEQDMSEVRSRPHIRERNSSSGKSQFKARLRRRKWYMGVSKGVAVRAYRAWNRA
jgi:hypothetical protein